MKIELNKLPKEMAEVLETVWTLEESRDALVEDVSRDADTHVDDALLQALGREQLIAISGTNQVKLLPEGRKLAEQIIRRHRLAERLICDVLGSQVEDSEAAACEFEHVLAEGVTNSICTLLGHPRFCPHNKPIPEGSCCRRPREALKPIVVSCDLLEVGELARIAYFSSPEHARLMKLSSLGIRPGAQVRLLQRWPSFVIQCEETEIALEEGIARNIYVRQERKE